MNERILELAKEAGLKFSSEVALSPAEKKFAQLIVKECGAVGSKAMYPDSDPDYVGRKIKEHFGVK